MNYPIYKKLNKIIDETFNEEDNEIKFKKDIYKRLINFQLFILFLRDDEILIEEEYNKSSDRKEEIYKYINLVCQLSKSFNFNYDKKTLNFIKENKIECLYPENVSENLNILINMHKLTYHYNKFNFEDLLKWSYKVLVHVIEEGMLRKTAYIDDMQYLNYNEWATNDYVN